ncbi:HTH_Tnp_Tc3_2 domain-containing protein [Trichonephila clavipes]|nr:HTH_Tnp_Tc3_2 domain-containing protein [Trichonephila clavipes]
MAKDPQFTRESLRFSVTPHRVLNEFIPSLKTTYENRERRENVSRELTSAGGQAFTKQRFANRSCGEGEGGKRRTTVRTSKHNDPAFVLFVVITVMMKIKDRSGCNVVALVHPGSMRNVSIRKERLERKIPSVHDCWQHWSREDTASRRPSFGGPCGITEREDPHLRYVSVVKIGQSGDLFCFLMKYDSALVLLMAIFWLEGSQIIISFSNRISTGHKRTATPVSYTITALTIPVLIDQVQQAWKSIPQTDIRHLYDTMYARLLARTQNSSVYSSC